MAIELHHLNTHGMMEQAGKVLARVVRLKARIAELEARNHDLEEERRWRKFPDEKPPKYTWCLVSGKSQMGNMIEPKLTVSDGTVSPCIEIDKRHIEAIAHEYWAAKEKHPEFCSAIIDHASSKSWIETEHQIKLRNECGPEYADCVLMEEVAEAFSAYSKGDFEHALQEFAQCGAVVMRCMFYVMEKIDINAKT